MKTRTIYLAAIFTTALVISQPAWAGIYSGGNGTTETPYRIGSVEDWVELTNMSDDWGSHFIMAANIDLANVVFQPVGTGVVPFTGTLDGNNHTIRNASIAWSDGEYVGLFGRVGSVGQIRGLGLATVTIWGGSYAGGLVGKNEGSISYCYITGTVHGYYVNNLGSHGGLAGSDSGQIANCGAIVDVDGFTTGGLVGFNDNYGCIINCYARGNVFGFPVGGLVGQNYNDIDENYATIAFCYASGAVTAAYPLYFGGLSGAGSYGIIADCFWDVETTGQTTTSGGGIGKTTAQMKTMTTFADTGWDFSDTWMGWYAPEEHYPELFLPLGPFMLTMQANPSKGASIIPSEGEHFVYGLVEIHAADYADCPNHYQFDYWKGNVVDPLSTDTLLFVDADTTVTAVFTLIPPVCGDECHPYPAMDFSRNCRVDLADLAMFATQWLDCTAPECD